MTSLDTPRAAGPDQDSGAPRATDAPALQPPQEPDRPPPVLPQPRSELDLEQSIKLMRESLHSRAAEMDQEYLAHVAAAGQMQSYQAAQMQQLVGNDLRAEMALLNTGLPLSNTRLPETRAAYEDWFADLQGRAAQAPGGVDANAMTELQTKYQQHQQLAQAYDQGKDSISSSVRGSLAAPERHFGGVNDDLISNTLADVAGGLVKSVSLGYLGPQHKTRMQQLTEDVKQRVDEVAAQAPRGYQRELRQLLLEEAHKQIQEQVGKPGMNEGPGFSEKVGEALGLAVPFGAAAKGGALAVRGVTGVAKSMLGRAAQAGAGGALGFAALGASQALNQEQEQRISSLPEGDQSGARAAARVENAVKLGLLSPIYLLAGKGGEAAGGALGKLLPGKLGQTIGGAGAGAGVGAAMPIASEVEQHLTQLGIENVDALRRLVEAKMIAKPELQGPVRGIFESLKARDTESLLANLKTYVHEAAPGMVGFGLLGAMHGLTAVLPAENRSAKRLLEEATTAARVESGKLAAGDPKAEAALTEVAERQATEIREVVDPPSAEKTLKSREATEGEAERTIQEELAVRQVEGPPETTPSRPRSVSSTLEAREAARAEARAALEESPTDPKAQLRHEIEDAAVRALQWSKAANNPSATPEVRSEAAQRALAERTYLGELKAWEKLGMKGPMPVRGDRASMQERARSELVAETTAAKPPREAVAEQALEYQSSEQRVLDEINLGIREPPAGAVIKDEGGHEFTVSGRSPDGGIRGGEPTGVEVTTPGLQKGDVRKAVAIRPPHMAGGTGGVPGAATGEAGAGVSQVSGAGDQHVHRGPEDLPRVAESRSKREAEGYGHQAAALDLVRQARLATGESVPKGNHSSEAETEPRQTVEALTPPLGARQAIQDLADAESLAAQIAGRPRSPFKLIADYKRERGKRSADTAGQYAKVLLDKAGVHEVDREFARYVAEHAQEASGKTGDNFAAELLNNYLREKLGLPKTSFVEETRYVSDALDAMEAEVKASKDFKHFVTWADAHAEHLQGPWSVVAHHHPGAKKLLDRVEAWSTGRAAESGKVDTQWLLAMPAWPVLAVSHAAKAIWRYPRKAHDAIMGAARAAPRISSTNMMRRIAGGYFESPVHALGHTAIEGIRAVAAGEAEVARVHADFFDKQSGKLGKIEEGSQMDRDIFDALDKATRATKLKELEARAAGSGVEAEHANEALARATEIRDWLQKAREQVLSVDPEVARMNEHLRYLNSVGEDIAARQQRRVEAGGQPSKWLERQATRFGKAALGMEKAIERYREEWGIEDYIKHASRFEILPGGGAGGAMATVVPAGGRPGHAAFEVRRRMFSDSLLARRGGLEKLGLLQRSAVRAMHHYIRSTIPYISRSKFLRKLDNEMFGNMEPPTTSELRRGKRMVLLGDKEALLLGTYAKHKAEVTTTAGKSMKVPHYLRGKEAWTEEARPSVLVWTGDPKRPPSRSALSDPKKVNRLLQSDKNPGGGLIALPASEAPFALRTWKGGLWEQMDSLRQGDFARYVKLVSGALSDVQAGTVGRELQTASRMWQKMVRAATGHMSAMLLGGPGQLHSMLNNVFSGTTMNSFFLGGGGHRQLARATTQFAGRLTKSWLVEKAERLGVKKAEEVPPAAALDPRGPSLSATYDKAFRTPEAELAKMAPDKAARQRTLDDAYVALMQSGILGANRANHSYFGKSSADIRYGRIERPGALRGTWEPARTKVQITPEGAIELLEPTAGARAAQFVDNVAAQLRTPLRLLRSAWWKAFDVSETYVRAPPFLNGYLEARGRGLTHDQALSEGLATTAMLAGMYNKAAKSGFLRSSAGQLMTNMGTWQAMVGGRIAALPAGTMLAYAGYTVALMAVMQKLGFDTIDQLGTRVSNIPLVGEKLNELAMGIGIRTAKDPAGKEAKGPLHDTLNQRSTALPLPLPLQFGPAVDAINNVIHAGLETWAGNGELAAQYLNRARAVFDPRYSTWWQQYEKAFSPENRPQSDQTVLRVKEGKGSTILRYPGALGWLWGQLPGTDMLAARQWQESRLSAAEDAVLRRRQREVGALGLDWALRRREAEDETLRPEARAASKAAMPELQARVREQAKTIGKKLDTDTWRGWYEEADTYRKLDMRARGVLKAPSKEEKVHELSKLLADPDYPFAKERFLELAQRLGGKEGFGSWLHDKDTPVGPETIKELEAALKKRRVSWPRASQK